MRVFGLNDIPAWPISSGREPLLDDMIGNPIAIISISGNPNPSYNDPLIPISHSDKVLISFSLKLSLNKNFFLNSKLIN